MPEVGDYLETRPPGKITLLQPQTRVGITTAQPAWCIALAHNSYPFTRGSDGLAAQPDKLLRKSMGFWSLTAASVGGVIGSGWLFGSLYAAQAAGPESIITWIVGGIALALVALVYSELAMVKPESGGLVRYPMYANGSLVASLIGWAIWLGYAANPPTEASGIVQYLSKVIPGVYVHSQLTLPGMLLATAFMLLFVAINYFGVQIFAKTNLVITILKFVVPLATLGAFFISGFHPANFTSHGFAPYGWSAGLSAIATAGIIFTYTGFRAAIDLAGEAKNPVRDVPRAVLSALGVAMILYIGLEVVLIGAIPAAALIHGWHGVNFNTPYADLALTMNLTWLYWMIMADSVVSPSGSSFVYTASNSRVVYGLGKNRYFPTFFANINPRWRVPTRALLLNFVVGLLFLVPLKSWHAIIQITGSLGVFTYSAGAVAVLVFRRMGLTSESRRIRGMPVIAPLGFVIGTLIMYWAGWSTLKATIPLLIVGLLVYAVGFVINRDTRHSIWGGLWLPVYLVVIFLVSALGSFGGQKLIPAPFDSFVVAACSLGIYYWAVWAGQAYMGKSRTPALQDDPS